MGRRILAFPILIGTPALAFAIGSTFQPTEFLNGAANPDTDGRYDRYTPAFFGASVYLIPPLIQDGKYLVEPGESWTFTWERLDQPQQISAFTLSYLGGDALCWSDGSCGPRSALYGGLKWPCMPEGAYRISVAHNGTLMGSHDFRPTRFRPAFLDSHLGSYIKPATSDSGEGETTDYSLVASDDLGCYQPLEGVEAKVTSYVVAGDLSHAHLSSDYGTGQFSAAKDFPATVTSTPPAINGRTNKDGGFIAQYQAGKHGVHERIVAQLTRPATADDPEIVGPQRELEIGIEVPDLVEITSAKVPVIFSDGGTCPHTPWPHWLTQNSLARVNAIAEAYQYITGRQLSLNDASLPYGGVIDNKLASGGGRDTKCHRSHRKGVDIDLNAKDSGGVNILHTQIQLDGGSTTLEKWLTYLVARFKGVKADEEPIHYHFPN